MTRVRSCLPNLGARQVFSSGCFLPLGCVIFVTLTCWRSDIKLIKGLCWQNIKAKGGQLESKHVPWCLSVAFYLLLFKLKTAHTFFLINKSRKFLNIMGVWGWERKHIALHVDGRVWTHLLYLLIMSLNVT